MWTSLGSHDSAYPSMHMDKTSTLHGHVPPCFKLLLGVGRPQHEVQVCLPAFRLLPAVLALPLAPARPAVGLASYSKLLHHAHITSSVCDAYPLPSLSGWAIYSSGPQLHLFPPAGSLDPHRAPYPTCACGPTEECFSKLQKELWVL